MKLKKVFIGILAAAVLLFLARGAIARIAVSTAVHAVTGLQLEIRRMEVGVFRSRVRVQGMQLHNPSGFPDPVLADLPELYVDYDLPAFFRGRTHVREMRLDLKEMTVVKNREGKLNLDSLTAVQKAKEQREKPAAQKKPTGAFRIDKLHLKVGRVVYKDYSRGEPPSIREFNLNLDEHYSRINDPVGLGALVVTRALIKTSISSMSGFDLDVLDDAMKQALRLPSQLLNQSMGTASDTLEGAAGTLKKLLPFGEEEKAK